MENELTKEQADKVIPLVEEGVFTQLYRENRGQRQGHFSDSYELTIKKDDVELCVYVVKSELF